MLHHLLSHYPTANISTVQWSKGLVSNIIIMMIMIMIIIIDLSVPFIFFTNLFLVISPWASKLTTQSIV